MDPQRSMIVSMPRVSSPDRSKSSDCEPAISHRGFIILWKVENLPKIFYAVCRGQFLRFTPAAAARQRTGRLRTGSNSEMTCLIRMGFADRWSSFLARLTKSDQENYKRFGETIVFGSQEI